MERLAAALSCHPLDLLENPPDAMSDRNITRRERDILSLFRSLTDGEQEALWEAVQPMVKFVRRAG